MSALRYLVLLTVLASAAAMAHADAGDDGASTLDPQGAAPTVLHYQSRFSTPGGDPLSGPVFLTFRLFAVAEGGLPLWTEEHPDVPLDRGTASVLLGSLTAFPANAFSAPGRYLEIEVDGQVLDPRLVLASSPFALEADRLDGKDATDFEVAGASAQLGTALSESDGTPPNQGSAPVHWDNLAGVPAGFADGTDDGGTGGGVTDHGDLTGLEDDDHAQYLLRSDAATSDGSPPNEGSARVHWDNLAGVPPGLADGADDTFSGGGVTGADVLDSTLTEIDLAPGTLTGVALADAAVTGQKVALETLTGDHIQDDGIRGADVLDGSLGSADLAAGSVTEEKIAQGAVGGAQVADGSIGVADLGFVVGDVTSVSAGAGLGGGGDTGDITISVGAGAGIDVQNNAVSLTPSYISGSAYDGKFVSRTGPSWDAVTGAAAVSGAAFRPVRVAGTYTVEADVGSIFVDDVSNPGAEDEFTAPIQLPHNAEIVQFWCSFWDDSAGDFEVSLWRSRQDGSTKTKIASVTTTDQVASWRSNDDDTITETSVDNLEFVYWLKLDFPPTPQGQDLQLLAVRVTYAVTGPN